MKVLIVSDSHGDRDILKELVKNYAGKVDYMVHLGDSELEDNDTIWQSFIPVKGNCDFGQNYKDVQILDTKEGRLLTTHGHLFGVKFSLNELISFAKENKASVVCYGHTHIIDEQIVDGIHIINPGSVRLPRGKFLVPTYAILDWNGDAQNVTFYTKDHEKLDVE